MVFQNGFGKKKSEKYELVAFNNFINRKIDMKKIKIWSLQTTLQNT